MFFFFKFIDEAEESYACFSLRVYAHPRFEFDLLFCLGFYSESSNEMDVSRASKLCSTDYVDEWV